MDSGRYWITWTGTPAGAAARRQVVGHRAGDGASKAERSAVSVPPAHDGERQAVVGTRHAAIRLGRRRPRLAGPGNQPAADGLEPPAADHSAAPQAGPRSGD